jgi:tRNA(Ile2) C34 agmatinyltransferase TiaS
LIAPDLGPCPKCGGQTKSNGYAREAKCWNPKCLATFTYDRDFEIWVQDKEPEPVTSSGDDFEDPG